MIEAIVGWVAAGAALALAVFGVRWKIRAQKSERQIKGYQESSDKWQIEAARRVEEIKKRTANQAPIDTKKRTDFE